MSNDRSLEQEWVSQARNGEMGAFGQLVTLHQKPVYGFILAMLKDPATADELTQDTFVKAWKGISGFRGESAFQTWLFQIAINTVRSWGRWKALRRFREISFQAKPDTDEKMSSWTENLPDPDKNMDPGARLEQKELGRKIEEAVRTLPPREKEVFLLRHYQDLPLKEIGRMMSIAEGSVKAHLSHALEKLRKRMEGKI